MDDSEILVDFADSSDEKSEKPCPSKMFIPKKSNRKERDKDVDPFPLKKRKIKVVGNPVKRRKIEVVGNPVKRHEVAVDEKDIVRQWKNEELVAEAAGVDIHVAENIVRLLDQDCTIPFIVRYRSELTGNLPAEKVRNVEIAYVNIKTLNKKIENITKLLSQQDIDSKVLKTIVNAKSMEELDYLYAPFKPGSKRSVAERARKLGLEPIALSILDGQKTVADTSFSEIITSEVPELSTTQKVKKGVQNIIADIIAKDRDILDFIHQHPLKQRISITCSKSASAVKGDKRAYVEGKQTKNFKFENYFNFSGCVGSINAHQVMAINRGENQKVLTVKLVIPVSFKKQITEKCWSQFFKNKVLDSLTANFMKSCVEDSYNRLLEPHIFRYIRSELTKKAEKESATVFSANLKQLLLTPPLRGKTVIGIDPGYKHGCKVAVVSCIGEVLHTDVIYPHTLSSNQKSSDSAKFVNIVMEYCGEIVAIGNGTACRETEVWLSKLIKDKSFHPIEVKYCIINESGVSIYSVSTEAEADLPRLEPNLRSAVGIARRLQDPLLEYVKVEPKHLGVGMYQHDIPETMLKIATDGVVVECVSFVGVDLNICPDVLLRKISGLSAAKAKQIIQWREKNGGFINREQLLEVKGLGPKSFEQCAGFVKILPQTSVKESETTSNQKKVKCRKLPVKPNLLDTTIIHPESYEIAKKFLLLLGACVKEVGTPELSEKVEKYMKSTSVKAVAENLGVSFERMQLIIDAFKQLAEYDIRAEFDTPLFHTGVVSLEDLVINQVLTGRITNVTNFGAFVDIGVGYDGLIHVSKMGDKSVHLGDRVSVKILAVDISKKRITLALL